MVLVIFVLAWRSKHSVTSLSQLFRNGKTKAFCLLQLLLLKWFSGNCCKSRSAQYPTPRPPAGSRMSHRQDRYARWPTALPFHPGNDPLEHCLPFSSLCLGILPCSSTGPRIMCERSLFLFEHWGDTGTELICLIYESNLLISLFYYICSIVLTP